MIFPSTHASKARWRADSRNRNLKSGENQLAIWRPHRVDIVVRAALRSASRASPFPPYTPKPWPSSPASRLSLPKSTTPRLASNPPPAPHPRRPYSTECASTFRTSPAPPPAISLQELGFANAFRLPDGPADAGPIRLAEQPRRHARGRWSPNSPCANSTANLSTQFKDDAKAMRDAQSALQTALENGSGRSAAIGPLTRDGNALVAKFDSIMHDQYTTQHGKFCAWRSASHVEHAPQR
jgi:hypothetical protein